jgi:DNA-binding transcriptional ArsR family regulator
MPPARFDRYVIETLMADLIGHDRQPSAFVVYLYLAHRAAGSRQRSVEASLQTIAIDTGLSKSAVQRGLRTLTRRRLVRAEKASRTAVPFYTVLRPWVRRSERV